MKRALLGLAALVLVGLLVAAGVFVWIRKQQSRNVRMSSIGRRAVLFVVPADRITTDDGAQVTLKVTLSAPAKPATREVKISVESED